jgi:hypothetical protein
MTYLLHEIHSNVKKILEPIQGVGFQTKFLSDLIYEVNEQTLGGQHFEKRLLIQT